MYLSDYVVFSKDKNDDYILIHTYLGNVDILEKKYADILLKSREDSTEIDFKSIPEDIYNQLIKKTYLVKDKNADKEKYIRIANKIKEVNRRKKVTYTIIPSYECNFRCSYCFELDVVGRKDNNKKMSKEIVDAIFKDIDKNIEMNKDVSILLFGGEPFLKNNKDINNHIAVQSAKRKIRLSAISNGYEMDSYIDTFTKGYFKNIQITLDGNKTIHDSRRYRVGGLPTFDKIVENIDKVLKVVNGPAITVRINVDKHNYGGVRELCHFFQDKGWTNNKKFDFYTKSVHACYAKEEERIYDSDVIENVKLSANALKNMSYNVTYRRMIKTVKSIFNQDNVLPQIKTNVCGAANGMKVVDSYGDIYACYEKVNSKKDRIGYIDFKSGEFIYNDKKELWLNRHVQNLNKCSKCCYSLICGGNCPEHGEVMTGDLYDPCCEDFKKVFEEVLLEIAP